MNDDQGEILNRLMKIAKSLSADEAAFLVRQLADPDVRRELESQLTVPDSSLGSFTAAFLRVAGDLPEISNPDSPEQLIPADAQLGRYRILNLVGRGGMGEVYRAHDPLLTRMVAIKILRHPYTLDREAKSLAALNHRHVCTVYDIGFQDDLSYVVTEFVDGESLQQRLRSHPGPLEGAHSRAFELADALQFVHRNGIVHRDLKPANIMLSPSGVKLLDFGIAKFLDTASPETLAPPGTVIGTPAYMSPEQFRGEAADQRSDIFSFGVILHEIFSGAPAFVSPRQEAIPVRQAVAGLPPELEQIIARCLSANPHDRYASMHQVKQELENPQLAVSLKNSSDRRPVPANVDITGTWISEDYYFQGDRRAVFKFKRYGPVVGGVVDVLEKKDVHYGPFERYNVHGAISEVSISGDQISFTALMRVDGILGTTPAEYPLRFAGVISVDLLKLAIFYKDGQVEFTATRSSDSLQNNSAK